MGNYFPVYRTIWTSSCFNKLDSKGKLVYLYLLTNNFTTQLGVCRVKLSYIATDCSVDEVEVIKILKEMHKLNIIRLWQDENLIFIHKFFRYTKGTIKSPITLSKTMLREYELLNKPELWELFIAEFNKELYEIITALEDLLEKAKTKGEITKIDDLNKLIDDINRFVNKPLTSR